MAGRLATAAIAMAIVAGCANDADQARPTGASAATDATFVGAVPGPNDPLLAVVAEAPDAGTRIVRAYLCDGVSVFEWFTGSASGDDLDLTSAGGARLSGRLSKDAVTGTVTLPGGSPLPFGVPLASGFADLYSIEVGVDGTLSSTSERGGRLTGRIGDRGPDNSFPVAVQVRSPEGQVTDLDLRLSSDLRIGRNRWIVGPGLLVKGTDVHPMQTVKTKTVVN